jgi:hypothetical protein
MKKIFALMLLLSTFAFGHAPLLSVDDNQDGTLYLEGGFSNGASAGGVEILFLEDTAYKGSDESFDGKKVLFKTQLGNDGSLDEVLKPKVINYLVVMNAGPGHIVSKQGPRLTSDELDDWQDYMNSLVDSGNANQYIEKLKGN